MLNAILFDLGGTVLAEKSYDLAAGYASISTNFDTMESLATLLNTIALGQESNREFSVLEWIETHLNKTNDQNITELLEHKLWDNTVSLEPMNGVDDVLKYLSDRSVRVAALSNAIFSSKCIVRELQKHNLAHYFEFVVSSADIGVRKPHGLAFTKSLDLFELGSSEVCYVGDNWMADVYGANSANILPIHFGCNANESSISVEHYQLNNWSDFYRLWEEISTSIRSNRN